MKNFKIKWIKLFCLVAASILILPDATAQNRSTLTGTITDDRGEGLLGVTVLVQGGTSGTVTDIDGSYALEVPADATIEVSYLGFKTEIIPVNNRTKIDITLLEDVEQLNEVVVVGYGTQKKTHAIGAVANIDGASLSKIPSASADQALLGKLAGVSIKTNSGGSGQPANIQIRGLSSISASNSPLIVVDGYPIQGDLSSINMQDVESINVLKDAASASIYGSRAGSGVILITTKQGKSGAVQLEYNFYGGIKNAALDNLDKNPVSSSLRKVPTVSQWAAFVASQGITDTPELDLAQSFGVDTDWYDEVYQTGYIMNHQLSARGGTENVKYYFSGNYVDDKGVVLNNTYSKYSFRANVDVKANDWLDLGVSINPTYSERRDIPRENHQLFRTAPWVPVYHNETTAAITGKDVGSFAHENDFDVGRNPGYTGIRLRQQSDFNPIALLTGESQTNNRVEGFANTYAKIKITDNLSFRTSFGGYINQLEFERFRGSTVSRNGVGQTLGQFNTTKIIDWLNENFLTYNKSVNNHDFTVVAGISTQSTKVTSSGVSSNNFVVDYIETVNGGQLSGGIGSTRSQSNLNSQFVRFDYALSDKYLVSLSSRWDGSSRFGASNQVGFFPAASIGWRVSEEAFLKSSDFVDNLKVRLSYGTTGNNTIGDYSHIGLLAINNSISGGSVATGFAPNTISNSNLGWERTAEINTGLDFGVLDGRVQLVLDYFQTSTEDLLLQVPLSPVTGYDFFLDNKGKVENKGFDVNLTTVNTTGKLKWSTNFNISRYQNELVDFGGTERLISVPEPKRPNEFLTELGSPLVQYYGYVSDGEVPWSSHQTSWPVGANTDYVFAKDLNGDGVINESDKTVLGNPYPDFTWGLSNNLSYGNLNLSIVIQGSQGAEVFSIDSYYENSQYVLDSPNSFDISDSDKDRLVVRSNSDANLQDASYISIRSLTLGYDIPSSVMQRIGLSGLNLYLTANNLLFKTADSYTGFNPEASTEATTFSGIYTNNPLVTGYQRGAHPLQKAFAIGVNVKF